MTPTTCPDCREARVVNGIWRHRCATFVEMEYLHNHWVDTDTTKAMILVPEMVPVQSLPGMSPGERLRARLHHRND